MDQQKAPGQLEPVPKDTLTRSVAYVLQQNRKLARRVAQGGRDDGMAETFLAQKVVAHMALCGYEVFRKPVDWSSRVPDKPIS